LSGGHLAEQMSCRGGRRIRAPALMYLPRDEESAALSALQAAVDACTKEFDEYLLAQSELKHLER
jgi:hypothetical protein